MSQLRPKDITGTLGISPATLRLWSNHFAPVLSPAAQKATTSQGTAAQRRYTDTDLRIFTRAKQLLGQGKTYEETLESLQSDDPAEILYFPTTNGKPPQNEPHDLGAVLATVDEHPVMLAFREALAAKDETIATLKREIETIRTQTNPPEPMKTEFRFRWLNWLLKP